MPIFRCYALNAAGQIAAAENIEAANLPSVIELGWAFVGARPSDAERHGLEIWRGSTLLFSTWLTVHGDQYEDLPALAA